jgi:hypothetical protein
MKQSPEPDGIINEVLKCGKFYLVHIMKKLFNHILKCGYFSALWKKEFIINIHIRLAYCQIQTTVEE